MRPSGMKIIILLHLNMANEEGNQLLQEVFASFANW